MPKVPKLTKRLIESLAPKSTDYFVWEEELPRFGIRVLPSARKTFVVQYRVSKRSKRMDLGPFAVLTPDAARAMAIQVLAAVAVGRDPLDERRTKERSLTVAELADIFIARHIDMNINLKESTGREYRHALKRYIIPTLGKLKVIDVTRAHIAELHLSMRDKPYQANRTLEVVSKMFNLAEEWAYRPDGSNPRKGIKKYPERKRERFLSSAELQVLGRVLREMEEERVELPSAIGAVRLLALTGCRLNEIMRLQWSYVDLRTGELRLPDSKTGKKVVHIGNAAVAVLGKLKRADGNPWVITGRSGFGRLSDLQPFWQRVRARAGFKDARIHDLRHTFASFGASNGLPLLMLGRLLGHTQVQTTARYAHLIHGTVKQAANDVCRAVEAGLSP